MNPNSIKKIYFNVENSHYEYVRISLSLKNAPKKFMRLMDTILRDLQGNICELYVINIIIFSTNLEDFIKKNPGHSLRVSGPD